jgi:hypothetical protein
MRVDIWYRGEEKAGRSRKVQLIRRMMDSKEDKIMIRYYR